MAVSAQRKAAAMLKSATVCGFLVLCGYCIAFVFVVVEDFSFVDVEIFSLSFGTSNHTLATAPDVPLRTELAVQMIIL